MRFVNSVSKTMQYVSKQSKRSINTMSMLQHRLCHKTATKDESNTCEFTKEKNNHYVQFQTVQSEICKQCSIRTVEIKG